MLFCLWLIPAPIYYKPIAKEISILHIQQGFPYFKAHLTLFCGQTPLPLEKLKDNFFKLFSYEKEITLKTSSLVKNHAFYKNFFVSFEPNAKLNSLHKLARNLNNDSTYVLDPHLSLAYGISWDILKEVKLTYSIPHTITFDRIALVTDSTIESYEAISAWRILDIINLKKSN